MIYIKNECTNPYYNLAFEEFVFNNMPKEQDYFMLWQNAPSIIIGKHQNTIEEINVSFVKERNIKVVRRMSGGGAVYHDLGNLNFTFIVTEGEGAHFDFRKFTMPVINALAKLGVKAEFNSRNDIAIDGRKFSGNAQYIRGNRLLHHGTLLFDSNLDDIQMALNVSSDKIESKGVKSVRSRVTNISEHMKEKIAIGEFKKLLLSYMFEENEDLETYELTEEELKGVHKLVEDKYSTWQWNFGESPRFNIKRARRFEGGKVEVLLNISGGKIEICKFYGDFFGSGDLTEVENKLIGLKYEENEIKKALEDINIKNYFSSISKEEILSCIIE